MYSVLIIEDDLSVSGVIESILQEGGFEVYCASDGQSGLALLHEKRPDLILCDIIMPNMDGHIVLENIMRERTLADIPFVFISGLGSRSDVRRGMTEGADDYLSKPFSANELLNVVNSRIRRRETILQRQDNITFQEEQTILRKSITKREIEVLKMVGQGITSKTISEQLRVSLRTVEAHRTSLMNKLGAPNAASLARWAVIAELMDLDNE